MYESKTIYEISSDLIIVTKFSMVQDLNKYKTINVKKSVETQDKTFRENKSLEFLRESVFFAIF